MRYSPSIVALILKDNTIYNGEGNKYESFKVE